MRCSLSFSTTDSHYGFFNKIDDVGLLVIPDDRQYLLSLFSSSFRPAAFDRSPLSTLRLTSNSEARPMSHSLERHVRPTVLHLTHCFPLLGLLLLMTTPAPRAQTASPTSSGRPAADAPRTAAAASGAVQLTPEQIVTREIAGGEKAHSYI